MRIEADVTISAVQRFNDAFGRGDVDGIMAQMTSDCAFETTEPPDGVRHEGAPAVRAAWETFFASAPEARFETEEIFGTADRAVVRWTYRWDGGHVRGVDVFRVRDGKVSEKLSYVKG